MIPVSLNLTAKLISDLDRMRSLREYAKVNYVGVQENFIIKCLFRIWWIMLVIKKDIAISCMQFFPPCSLFLLFLHMVLLDILTLNNWIFFPNIILVSYVVHYRC